MSNVEVDKIANKSDEKIRANAIRTTANNICYPILFLCSQDKANYKFKDNRVMVNIMALSEEVVKSVFGFKKDKIINKLQLVSREEFEVLKKIVQKQEATIKKLEKKKIKKVKKS